MKAALLTLALLGVAPTAHAVDCSTVDIDLAPGWEAWMSPGSITAAAKAADQPEIALGQAYVVQLQPADQTIYEIEPYKGVTAGTYGGLLMLNIQTAGNYVVALGDQAWIDVLRDGQAVKSTSHSEGGACLPIRKTVTFPLTPGTYTLQLANAPSAKTRIEVKAD